MLSFNRKQNLFVNIDSELNPSCKRCLETVGSLIYLLNDVPTKIFLKLGDQQNTITKVNLLNKVLGIVAGVLLIDHEVRRKEFQQVPYHR